MKKLLILIFFFPLALLAQTAQLNFTYKNGTTVGRSIVRDLPVMLFQPWVPQGQLLIFNAPTTGKYKPGLIVFSAGDGEQNSLDVTQVNKNSLPRMIAAGMTPYSLIGKDTMYWTVVSIHYNAGSAYRSQLAQILPYILDFATLSYDSKKVWLAGLSGGGSATWASIMIDTTLSKRITGIMPLANGGYDGNLSALMQNLVKACSNGVYFFPYIGTQDPGYNASGFFAYDAVVKNYALPDHYHPHIIPGGTHSANVWDVPFNSRVIWDSLGLIGQPVVPVKTVHARMIVDSTVIHYPNSVVHLSGAGSYATAGKIVSNDWFEVSGPSAAILTSCDSSGYICVSGLRPGTYRFKLVVTDSVGNQDSAFVNFQLNGAPACPVCPVCPAQRTVTAIQVSINGILFSIPLAGTKVTYSDGSNQ